MLGITIYGLDHLFKIYFFLRFLFGFSTVWTWVWLSNRLPPRSSWECQLSRVTAPVIDLITGTLRSAVCQSNFQNPWHATSRQSKSVATSIDGTSVVTDACISHWYFFDWVASFPSSCLVSPTWGLPVCSPFLNVADKESVSSGDWKQRA